MGVLDTFSLRGKTAVVTAGAGPLFGSSISEALAEAGARVITASRSLARNQEYAAALARQTGAEVHGMELDIGDAAAIERFHAEVIDRFGNVEVLVNSALVRDATAGSFETQTIDAWQRSAAGDMVGLYAICKAFVGSMVAAGGGSIINISSIYGVVGNDPSLYEDTEMVQAAELQLHQGRHDQLHPLCRQLLRQAGRARELHLARRLPHRAGRPVRGALQQAGPHGPDDGQRGPQGRRGVPGLGRVRVCDRPQPPGRRRLHDDLTGRDRDADGTFRFVGRSARMNERNEP